MAAGESGPDEGLRPEDAFSHSEFDAAVRGEFYSFLMRVFSELHAGQTYSPAWHVEVLASKLQRVGAGRTRRLILNVPPRHLKSLAASVALPAWLLGHDPTLSVVNVTYAQDLSEKFARDCRLIMTAPWYQALFRTRLASAREPLDELVTTEGGFRLATSVGGVLTGRGADVIVIDDPLKPIDAHSESRRAAANDWFDSTLYSRLNDKAKGAIVIVMQRLHEDDLTGHVLKQEDWEVAAFPAIAEADEQHEIETPLGPRAFQRQAGEALHPAREPLAVLEQVRATLGEQNFAAQYQQRPAPAGGGMIKPHWFRRYGERPQTFDRIVQSWDTANTAGEGSDWSVCTTWGLKGPEFYLIDVLRKKLIYPDLKRAVIEADARFAPDVILIEDRASGAQLIQELITGGLLARHAGLAPGRQGDADARREPDDRERLCPVARKGALARRLPRRIYGLPQRPPRRPGRTRRPRRWPGRSGGGEARRGGWSIIGGWWRGRGAIQDFEEFPSLPSGPLRHPSGGPLPRFADAA